MALETDIGVIERPKPRLVEGGPKVRAAAPAKPRTGPPTDQAYPGWLRVLILFGGIVITYAAIFALTAFALSVMS